MKKPDVFAEFQELGEHAVCTGVAPRISLAFGSPDWGHFQSHHGSTAPLQVKASGVERDDELFDLASLTKVIATTSVAIFLCQRGLLDLDTPLQAIIPGFQGEQKSDVTIEQLLSHTSGLPAYVKPDEGSDDPELIWQQLLNLPLENKPGNQTNYSCVGFNLLFGAMGLIIAGRNSLTYYDAARHIRELFISEIAYPLDLQCLYCPPNPEQCVPTEITLERGLIQGQVHDELAWAMGGIAGNAGLFGSLEDICIFARFLLGEGPRLFDEKVLKTWTRVASGRTRGLGWDTKSKEDSAIGSLFSDGSFGHFGFTGTSLWIDPDRRIYGVILSNRTYPSRDNLKIRAFRSLFYDKVAQAFHNR